MSGPVLYCSRVGEMSTNSSKQGSILVNSAVRHNCGKIREIISHSRKETDRAERGL